MYIQNLTTIGSATSGISDHQLLDRYITERTPDSFLELVGRHSGLVYGTCFRITRNHQDAEDLTQECFFDLVRQAGQIRTSLSGWLHQVATNRALNRLRTERRRKDREREAGLQTSIFAERSSAELSCELSCELPWNQIEPLIDHALSEMPEHLRVPILMHYLERTTQSDIANALGVHQSTVSRRLSDGLCLLRERLHDVGLALPTTILVTWLTSHSAVAAPSSLSSSLGKMALAGIGTANVSGTGQIALLTSIAKGVAATLFLPAVAGIVWGELVFLLILALCCGYLGLRRPEFFRVLCFTRQVPNIYEWHFFPFKRWTWRSPPREWRIWMAASFIIGIELLGLAVILPLFFGSQQGSLLLTVGGMWNIFVGARIWRHVRRYCTDATGQQSDPDYAVDGALLLTLAFACAILFAKLSVTPWFLSAFTTFDSPFWLIAASFVIWATVLLFGTVLVLRRLAQWRRQRPVDQVKKQHLDRQAPPRWLHGLLFLVPTTMAMFLTFVALVQDVNPLYVPFGDDALVVAQRQSLALALSAMDCVVLASLPLSYLFRRIPHVAWGVGFGVLGLTALFHIGFFTKGLLATSALSSQPRYARAPLMDVLPHHFVFSTVPRPTTINSPNSKSSYMSTVLLATVRVASASTVLLEFDEQSAVLNIPHDATGRMAVTGVIVMVQIAPDKFEAGIPERLQLSLIIGDSINRQNQVKTVQLAVPSKLTAEQWRSQFQLRELVAEQSIPYGKAVSLGTVQGRSLTLKLIPSESNF